MNEGEQKTISCNRSLKVSPPQKTDYLLIQKYKTFTNQVYSGGAWQTSS